MTDDPIGEEIPELLEQLEASVNAPDVDALHAVHNERQAAQKRTLSAVGVFVALLALAGGILSFNRDDDTTSTVTADDLAEPIDVEAATDSSDSRRAVAEDSAPFEIKNLPSDHADQGLRSILSSQTWRVGNVTGDSDGFTPQLGTVSYVDGPDADHGTLTYTNGCEGSAYTIEWTDITGAGIRVQSELPTVPIAPNVACLEATKQSVLAAGSWMTLTTASNSTLRLGTTCHPLALCTPGGFWTAELIGTETFEFPDDSETDGSAVVVIEECANGSWLTFEGQRWLPWDLPAEWEGQGQVDVTLTVNGQSLIAADDADNSARFGLDDGTPRPQPCNGFTLDQGTSPDTTGPIISPTTTVPIETRTTTTVTSVVDADSMSPTTAPLLSSTARAWNVQWVANSAFHGAVIEIGPIVSKGIDYGPGGTADNPNSAEGGSPMVFRTATVLESSSGDLSGKIVLGDLDHAAMEVPYAPYVEGDLMFLFISPQYGHTRPDIPIDDVFWVATNNDESKFDILDDLATPRSNAVTALRRDDEQLEPGSAIFTVADLLQITSEAAGCVFIGAQNPFC